jgi:hypothetical protein
MRSIQKLKPDPTEPMYWLPPGQHPARQKGDDADCWRALLIQETARTVRAALQDWSRTARLCLLTAVTVSGLTILLWVALAR